MIVNRFLYSFQDALLGLEHLKVVPHPKRLECLALVQFPLTFACYRGFSLELGGSNVNDMAVVEAWSFCFSIVGIYDAIPVMCYDYELKLFIMISCYIYLKILASSVAQ